MLQTPLETKCFELLAPSVSSLGYRLVRVKMREKLLQIMAEPVEDREMTVDDCEKISPIISAILDVEDPIASAYDLEVSSPGLDRPLVALEDFTRFAGREAKIEMGLPVGGQKRFKGRIQGVKGDQVVLETPEKQTLELSFAGMDKAHLVITDEVIRDYLRAQDAKEKSRKENQ